MALKLAKLIDAEKRAFEILKPTLNLRKEPSLINACLLTFWLWQRFEKDGQLTIKFMLLQASVYRAQLLRSKAMLTDWQHFVDWLSQSVENFETASFQGA